MKIPLKVVFPQRYIELNCREVTLFSSLSCKFRFDQKECATKITETYQEQVNIYLFIAKPGEEKFEHVSFWVKNETTLETKSDTDVTKP